MNICVLFSLLLLLAPSGCPIYSVDLSTLEVPNDFQNELTLQSMLSSEMHQYRNKLNSNTKLDMSPTTFQQADPFDRNDMMRSIEDRIKSTYAAASAEESDTDLCDDIDRQPIQPQPRHCVSEENVFMGTNLFGCHPKHCFSSSEIALMSARKDFEMLIPKSYPRSLLNDNTVYMLMKYFNTVNQVIKRMSDAETRRLLRRALYDALGGYLRYYLVPVGQVSYYAGRVKLCTVQRLVTLYRKCLMVLNTNGNGWKMPEQDILAQLNNVHILPIQVNDTCASTENDASSCAMLDHSCRNNDGQNEQMIVPLPHLELEDSFGFLSNIYLPFKHRRIYNLRSPESAFVLVKFFKTVSNCYRFQSMSQKTYNQKLRIWIRENVQLHYRDEMFYPGLGGVLQIYEALNCPFAVEHTCEQEKEQDQETSMGDTDYDIMASCKKARVRGNQRYGMPRQKETIRRKQGRSPRQNNLQLESLSKTIEEDIVDDAVLEHDGRQMKKPVENKEQNQYEIENEMELDDQKSADPLNAEQLDDISKIDANGDDCPDCDESYVGYAAVILALLLVLLLLLICFCLQRNRKCTKLPTRPEPKPERTVPLNEPVRTTYPYTNESDPPNKKKSKLKSSKSKSRACKRLGSKIHNQLLKTVLPSHTGTSLVGSNRGASCSFSIANEDKEKAMTKKKSTSFDEDMDTFTSTSSLGYQFPRKFIPLKMGREKKSYYGRSEKKRSKQEAKETVRDEELGRERERDSKCNIEEEVSEKRQRIREHEQVKLLSTDERKPHNKGKHKREKGGCIEQDRGREMEREREREMEGGRDTEIVWAQDHDRDRERERDRDRDRDRERVRTRERERGQEREILLSQEHMRYSDTDMNRNGNFRLKESSHEKELVVKSSDVTNSFVTEESSLTTLRTVSLAEPVVLKPLPLISSAHSNVTNGSSTNTGSWETTYDDDSK